MASAEADVGKATRNYKFDDKKAVYPIVEKINSKNNQEDFAVKLKLGNMINDVH